MDNFLVKILNKIDYSRERKLKPISVLNMEKVINYCTKMYQTQKTIIFLVPLSGLIINVIVAS